VTNRSGTLNRTSGGSTSSAGQASDQVMAGSARSSGGWLAANGFKLAWLLIALLLAFLFFLFGAALARRRRTPEPA
jgi:hypothetical protein